MNEAFSRTAIQLGEEAIVRLNRARIAVFGVGGVGGYAIEALARAGVGTMDLFDDDKVSPSNINRQIIATHDTVGQYKVDAAAARITSINPEAVVNTHKTFYLPQNASEFDLSVYDYVVDAIDTVAGKIALAEAATAAKVPLISCMGAGNKLDATAFKVADISKTTVCPLARVMRKELGKRGIRHLKVVYSTELPLEGLAPGQVAEKSDTRPEQSRAKPTPGSNPFVPAVAGLILAGEVIRDLTGYAR
ncbi:MAG: tRNA threonylcarbamoyladenosine dehydratase [Ruminococcaceae bacterium]|nr:tRNA threonylcarbamoyladenosine dehydratase [Oscillospiraceae bacterium]